MTDSDTTAPQPSLIQQRLALQRRRNAAIFSLCLGATLLILWAVLFAVDGPSVGGTLGAISMALLAIVGAFSLRSALRGIRAFEAEHGADAGVQKP